jgi:hypothetical protein
MASIRHQLGDSANKKRVYACITVPPLSATVSRNPHLLSLIKEVIPQHTLAKETECLEYDMGRSIGYCEVTEVKETDAVFYAKKLKAEGFTKFVKNHKAQQTSLLTIRLERDEAGDYELRNIWLGKDYPAMPGDPDATDDSKAFWDDHAVIFNGQAVIASTVTKDCPY